MNYSNLNIAIDEARRFIAAAKALARAHKAVFPQRTPPENIVSAPKQSGAARRASMDLTRALAELRRP